ncbi:unnamed protein product [Meloidogyne enterolobii]|uniref:Uncharacterized protein n=1 Tax=Meloidogyne enterolobii TaxID=390850 RepID=A0ACB0ZNQ2_MELEN
MVVVYHSLEACSILLLGTNVMWDEQSSVLITHGIVSAATTSSTLLVVFITFRRFLVVWWPLKYARIREPKRNDQLQKSFSSMEEACTENSGIFKSGGLARSFSKRFLSTSTTYKKPNIRKILHPFIFPSNLL